MFKQFDNLPRPIPNAINEESDTSNRVVERQSRDDDNKTYMCAELKVVEGTIICGLQGGAAQNSHNEGFDALIRKCLEYREMWLEQSSEEREYDLAIILKVSDTQYIRNHPIFIIL